MHDYIVVGAGSAGAPLAARLSEDPDISILLLEAGPDYPSAAQTPPDLLDSRNLGGLEHDWHYVASPVPGRTIPYRRGKVVGGCSAMNAAAAMWGRPADFAEWAGLGNSEWPWDRVLPYFQRLESERDAPGPLHGTSGPLPICRYRDAELIPIQRAFHEACRSLGFADVFDHNDPRHSGVGPWPMNQGRHHTDFDVARLPERDPWPPEPHDPVEQPSRTGAARRRARGGHRAGRAARGRAGPWPTHRALGRCHRLAGDSTSLRHRPAADLRALGIEVRCDLLGVGAQLWDHPAVPIRLVPKPGQCIPGRDPRLQMVARFTAPESTEADDMQVVLVSHLDLTPFPALLAQAGVPVVALLNVALMRPRGHGHLSLASTNPAIQPRIELNFCADQEDSRRLLAGTRLAWQIATSAPMLQETERIVGLTEEIVRSDELLGAYVRDNVGTYCHALGTTRMGPDGDPGAVVDQYCRLRCVENLWVVDASVIPTIPRVPLNLITIMIGQRVADWLRASSPDSMWAGAVQHAAPGVRPLPVHLAGGDHHGVAP